MRCLVMKLSLLRHNIVIVKFYSTGVLAINGYNEELKMTLINYIDEEELESEQDTTFELRQKSKARKRRWREIESIKETRRLKRELAELNVHSWL